MELEIPRIPSRQPGEVSHVEMHSLLNVLNVIQGELTLIGLHLASDVGLRPQGLALCDRVKASFSDQTAALAFARCVPEEENTILAEIDEQLARYPAKAHDAETLESLANIHSVFRILEARAQETLANAREPGRWIDYRLAELCDDFHSGFTAIEKNSRGRYRIICNLAQQRSTDYYIDFELDSANGSTIAMPFCSKM